MICCFCGGSTLTVADDEYVELTARFPAVEGGIVQALGAHAECLELLLIPVTKLEQRRQPDVEAAPRSARIVEVPPYDAARGIVAPVEGGTLDVSAIGTDVVVSADPPGLRDLARWLLALSHRDVPPHAHVRLEPGQLPLAQRSRPLVIARAQAGDLSPSG
jgi:hypothetical protein